MFTPAVKEMAVPFDPPQAMQWERQGAVGAPELDVEAVAVPVQGPDADGVLGNVCHLLRRTNFNAGCQGLSTVPGRYPPKSS